MRKIILATATSFILLHSTAFAQAVSAPTRMSNAQWQEAQAQALAAQQPAIPAQPYAAASAYAAPVAPAPSDTTSNNMNLMQYNFGM